MESGLFRSIEKFKTTVSVIGENAVLLLWLSNALKRNGINPIEGGGEDVKIEIKNKNDIRLNFPMEEEQKLCSINELIQELTRYFGSR